MNFIITDDCDFDSSRDIEDDAINDFTETEKKVDGDKYNGCEYASDSDSDAYNNDNINNSLYIMKYFTISELCKSTTALKKGIDNTPTQDVEKCLIELVEKILDPLREKYGSPIIVDSGYRCDELNKIVGGDKNSQHRLGQAVDIRTVSDTLEDNMVLFNLIKSLNLPYDQLIFEYGDRKKGPNWIHVSYSNRNRRQIIYIGC